jgi:lysophospholipase L1-like esterase
LIIYIQNENQFISFKTFLYFSSLKIIFPNKMATKKYLLIILPLFLIFSGNASNPPKEKELVASELKPLGRVLLNDQKELELITSAAHFGFSFKGKNCQVYAAAKYKGEHNYLQYELDGKYQKRIRITDDLEVPIVINAPSDGPHTVWIYKTTEATTGTVKIKKIVGGDVKPLKIPAAPLIEFIGNSITCGAAADPSEVPCGTGDYLDQHNAYMAYGPRIARALKVNFVLSSVSGIGVYRNWNSDGPTMPQVYEKIDFQENTSEEWDFKKLNPRVVSIALGTNDFSGGDGKKVRLPFDSARYISNYVEFIKKVKSKYPSAKIVLLNSPMMSGENRTMFHKCLETVKAKVNTLFPSDPSIDIFFSQPMQARGCSGHPNVEDHDLIAKDLLPFFEKLLEQK